MEESGPPAEPADEGLMAMAQRGDGPAFERLVKRYEHRLFNYIRRMVGSSADAEDLFQETFLRVYRHRNRFRTSARFRPWVYRIATNLCRDHLRYRRRRPALSLNAPAGDAGTALADTVAAPNPGPEEYARERELAAHIEAAIGRLSLKHRSVFVMARYEGMAYGDIARALRIPVGTVKSRMNHAVAQVLDDIGETKT